MTTTIDVETQRGSQHATGGRPRTTMAAILVRQRAPLEVATVEIPELGVGQVLVRVKASGICGKQLDEISGRQGEDAFLPHLLGHEGAGIVIEIGPGVRKVKPGDHVVLHWMKGSGIDCLPPRFTRNGTTISAGWVTTFSEYTIASENRVTSIPDDVPFDVASLLGCAVTTGLGIVFNDAGLTPAQSIAVFGVGGVGINVIQGASLVNAHPIVAIDLHDTKLKQAIASGATHTINASRTNAVEALRELSDHRGVDVAVDLTGLKAVRETAYQVTTATGKTIFAGVPRHDEPITIDSFPFHFGRDVTGVHGGDTKPDVDIPRYLQLYQRGCLKLQEQITHRYPLEQVNEAVAQVRDGKAGRCVLMMPAAT
jgi:S-(hydroxymethyl)glutathione dehydrogenase / alcohol dehydrogenase